LVIAQITMAGKKKIASC